MEKFILYVDDVAHAREYLREHPAVPTAAPDAPLQWIVVACAPRMTHRISKWVSHSARENWRAKWFAKVQEQLLPLLAQGGNQVSASLAAKGPLAETTRQLRLAHGAAVVIDARRPRIGVELEPLTPTSQRPGATGWVLPSALACMGSLLALATGLGE